MVAVHMANLPETDDWLFVNRGLDLPVPDDYVDYTAGKVSFTLAGLQTTATYENTSKMIDNAFCGVMTPTPQKTIMMAGGHGKVWQ
jgi:hypothetical protein